MIKLLLLLLLLLSMEPFQRVFKWVGYTIVVQHHQNDRPFCWDAAHLTICWQGGGEIGLTPSKSYY
jgi:hypothetical protein